MSLDLDALPGAVILGVGGTLAIDGWNWLLKRVWQVPSLSYCMLGRWILHMPGGTFRHRSIGAAPAKGGECAVGWIAHYSIGIGLAIGFVLVVSSGWLARPTLPAALVYGIATAVFPLFVMQPAFGLGLASSRAPNPLKARLKSLGTHTAYGLGLFLSGQGLRYLTALGG